MNSRSAIGRWGCWNPLFLLVVHSTCVLRWVGGGTRRSDRLECCVLARASPRLPNQPFSHPFRTICPCSFRVLISLLIKSKKQMVSSSFSQLSATLAKAWLPTWRDLGFASSDARHILVSGDGMGHPFNGYAHDYCLWAGVNWFFIMYIFLDAIEWVMLWFVVRFSREFFSSEEKKWSMFCSWALHQTSRAECCVLSQDHCHLQA